MCSFHLQDYLDAFDSFLHQRKCGWQMFGRIIDCLDEGFIGFLIIARFQFHEGLHVSSDCKNKLDATKASL